MAKKRKKKRAAKKVARKLRRRAARKAASKKTSKATRKSRRAMKSAKKAAKKVARKSSRRRKVKKNPESISIVARKVVGTTKKGKKKYQKVRKVHVGTRPTLGEMYSDKARGHLAKEAYRRLKPKARKSKRGKKLKSVSKKYLKKATTASKRRGIVGAQSKGLFADLKQRRYSPSRKSVYKKRKNPFGGTMNKIEQLLGTSVKEVGGLAAGGLLYGAVNAAAAKYAKPVHSQLAKIPVVGTALPTLLIGALANYIGERQGIDALKVVGKGLVGASVVGMGVNASQMVPALRPAAAPIAGMGYEEMYGLPEGLGSDEADFGADEADFGGVDYTMEGVDYTMEGQLGDEADFGGVDYTMEGYGELPEGMGEGQLG